MWLICLAAHRGRRAGQVRRRSAAAARDGLSWRESAALGALVNTRGLMELIILNVGLDLGLITPTVFAMMVLMATSPP
jgi:Kef-type K+ transport system membrane component KefB